MVPDLPSRLFTSVLWIDNVLMLIRIRIQLFTLMRIRNKLFTLMRIRIRTRSDASIVSVQSPPHGYFLPLKLLNFDFNADTDPAFKNNAEPTRSGFTKLINIPARNWQVLFPFLKEPLQQRIQYLQIKLWTLNVRNSSRDSSSKWKNWRKSKFPAIHWEKD